MLVTLGVVAATAVPVPVALASGPPRVHVDPGSPAGKQYAFPVPAARGLTSGQSGGGGQNPPAFGVGITPSSGGGGRGGHGGSAGGTTGGGSRRRNGHASATTAQSLPGTSASVPTPPAGDPTAEGGSGWIALVLGGAAVLALGGAGGFALRRRLS